MRRIIYLLAVAAVAACAAGDGTNPFSTETETPPDTTDPNTGIDSDRTLPPGTTSPTANGAINRFEPEDTDNGTGFAKQPSYNATNDTFTIDNLAFDGDGT